MAGEIKWITVNGVHVPIMKGQTQDEAVKAFIEERDNRKQQNGKDVGELRRDAMWYVNADENRKSEAMKTILDYYGYKTIEEASKDMGYGEKDTIRALIEMYEDDTAPEAN